MHLDGLSFSPAVLILCRTCLSLLKCCSNDLPKTITSSRYARHVSQVSPSRVASINLAKVAGALQRPKGRTLNWYNCPPLVEKAVFSLSSSATGTCQYPDCKSSVEKNLLPSRASRESSILGKGVASFLVTSFSFL